MGRLQIYKMKYSQRIPKLASYYLLRFRTSTYVKYLKCVGFWLVRWYEPPRERHLFVADRQETCQESELKREGWLRLSFPLPRSCTGRIRKGQLAPLQPPGHELCRFLPSDWHYRVHFVKNQLSQRQFLPRGCLSYKYNESE